MLGQVRSQKTCLAWRTDTQSLCAPQNAPAFAWRCVCFWPACDSEGVTARFCPPFCTAFKIGGRLGVGCAVGGPRVTSVLQNAGTRPPRFALPPRFGGLLGEDLGVEVRIGRPHEPHRKSRSSRAQNANVQEATESPPVLGGSAKRGGLVTHSAKPPTRSPPKRGAAPKARGACHTFCKTVAISRIRFY